MNNLLQLILHKSIGMCLFKELRLTCWKFDLTLQWVKMISTTDYAGNMVGVRRKKKILFNPFVLMIIWSFTPTFKNHAAYLLGLLYDFFKIIILEFIFVFQ